MIIPVNKDLDSFQDDFFKGLTLKQTAASAISVAIGTAFFLFCIYILKLDQAVSFYLSLPVVLPVAGVGFLKIHGLTLTEYLKRKRRACRQSIWYFVPDLTDESEGEMKDTEKVMYLDDGGREEAAV